jgi:putative tryptophan/tyrosine transport system substrate-binding protein
LREFSKQPNGGLLVPPDATTTRYHGEIIALATRFRLPAIYAFREFIPEGGLMSFGVEVGDLYRRAATYLDRILRGKKPSDLPVQASTKFEFVVNTKAARQIGLDIPRTLLARADEVIE